MNQVFYLAEHTSNLWAVLPDHRFAKSGQPEPDEGLFLSPRAPNATAHQSDFELSHLLTPQQRRGLAVGRRVPARAYERPPVARECVQAPLM
jgi:hypothetical protein